MNLLPYLHAGYPGLYLCSHEERRCHLLVRETVAQLPEFTDEDDRVRAATLYSWTCRRGLVTVSEQPAQIADAMDIPEMITAVIDLPQNSIILVHEIDLYLDPCQLDPLTIRALRDGLQHAKQSRKTLVFLGCRRKLPPELARDITILDIDLPGPADLTRVADGIAAAASMDLPTGAARDALLDAAAGLTTIEAENAFALSVVTGKPFDAPMISHEKAETINQGGMLEILEPTETLDDIGGLDVLKTWLLQRRDAFSQRAVQYGLPTPKGALIIGVPGTGKSLTAKAAATVFQRPLLKLDAGRLYGSLVGESEGNFRSVIQTAEAIAPCILWIDEIEKGFSGSQSSGRTDGGTSARVFGSFLSWMQEKTSPVFVVATANDVSQLPPEFLRRGRFDELFFVDLPDAQEREAIWQIHLARHHSLEPDIDVLQLVDATAGFTGAEIEQVVIDALYAAFSADELASIAHLRDALEQAQPLSRLMGDEIQRLRDWADGRTRRASTTRRKAPPANVERRLAAPVS